MKDYIKNQFPKAFPNGSLGRGTARNAARRPIGKPPLEDHEQKWVAQLLGALRVHWCHVPNEAKRSVVGHVEQARKGLQKGAPDILIFTPPPSRPSARGVAIELKRRRAKGVSHRGATDEQLEYLTGLEACGWVVRVCEGLDETRAFLASLGWVS